MTTQTLHFAPEQLLTIGQAALVIGVHPDTLRNWDRSGKFPALRHPINGYRLYKLSDLQRVKLDFLPVS